MPTQRPITPDLRAGVFHDAVAVVERHYADELQLDDVARRIATSRRHLQRVFAEIGDTTFRTALTAVRMRRAAELLADTSLTVREICDAVGYRQPAQFAKAFRRVHGCAPTDYRACHGGRGPVTGDARSAATR